MNKPLVSIIIPVRNEEGFIEHTLDAVFNQNYPADQLEILIADGMSDDRTLDIIQQSPHTQQVRIITNPKRIQAAGLNALIQEARGEFIIRVDGHTIIAPDYVYQCVRLLQTTQAENVGGAMKPVGITPMGKAIAAAGRSAFAVPTAFHVSQTAQYTDTVYLGAWPRRVFDQIGLYNEQVGVNEDYELNYRIRQAGGKIFFSPEIKSEYYGRQTLRALAKQYFRYGRSKVKTLRQHPASLRPRQIVAPLFTAGLIIGGVLSLFIPVITPFWLAGVVLYMLTDLFFSVKIAKQSGWALLWRLPLVFLTIHLSWGAGFWLELLWPRLKL